jgi:lipoate-protein ligase A
LTAPWRVETATGPAARLLDAPPVTARTVRFLVPEDRAVVLGSTQPHSDIDAAGAAGAGVAVLRRRSGGGAVLVGPAELLWTDVFIPASDPLWTTDVGRAFWWLGDIWAHALAAAGIAGAEVWRGGLVRTRWSPRICFAGLGAGEVTVGGDKVVGLSQRRSRAGAHFQGAVLLSWNPAELLAVMALDDEHRAAAAAELAGAACGVGPEVAMRLAAAFTERLPE